MVNNRTDMTINIANAVLGGILFLSPWLLGFSQETITGWREEGTI